MKRLLLFFIVSFTIINAKGQFVTFEWQPNGSMLTKNGESSQVVSFPEKTKEKLYQELLVSASSIYNNPQKTISYVENKLISINAVQPIIWNVGGLLGAVEVNFHYVLKMHIKDGKIKVDAPYFSLLTFSTGASQPNIPEWVKAQKFFKSDGTYRTKKGKQEFCLSVNEEFNALINQILKMQAEDEDW